MGFCMGRGGKPSDNSKYTVDANPPTTNKMVVANAGLFSLVANQPFKAAMTGIPSPATLINSA